MLKFRVAFSRLFVVKVTNPKEGQKKKKISLQRIEIQVSTRNLYFVVSCIFFQSLKGILPNNRTDPNIKRQHATKNGQRDAQHLTGNYSLHMCTKMRRSTTITALELKDWCTTNLSSSRGETSKREQLVLKKQEERKKETIVENPKDGWWERQGDKDFKKTKIKKILEKVRRNRS